jgi:hypothetical protein
MITNWIKKLIWPNLQYGESIYNNKITFKTTFPDVNLTFNQWTKYISDAHR